MTSHRAPAFRKIVADSNVVTVAIAALVIWSFYYATMSLAAAIEPSLDFIASLMNYLATAVAIRGVPSARLTVD